jgi:hypothetical protein
MVDRDVPIAIYKLRYRAGTARSTFTCVHKVFAIDAIHAAGRA